MNNGENYIEIFVLIQKKMAHIWSFYVFYNRQKCEKTIISLWGKPSVGY